MVADLFKEELSEGKVSKHKEMAAGLFPTRPCTRFLIVSPSSYMLPAGAARMSESLHSDLPGPTIALQHPKPVSLDGFCL